MRAGPSSQLWQRAGLPVCLPRLWACLRAASKACRARITLRRFRRASRPGCHPPLSRGVRQADRPDACPVSCACRNMDLGMIFGAIRNAGGPKATSRGLFGPSETAFFVPPFSDWVSSVVGEGTGRVAAIQGGLAQSIRCPDCGIGMRVRKGHVQRRGGTSASRTPNLTRRNTGRSAERAARERRPHRHVAASRRGRRAPAQ